MSTTKHNLGPVIVTTFSAAIGGFLFGFDSSVINGANIALKSYFGCSDAQLGLAVSMALIGAALGAYFAGRLADVFGRVQGMLAAAFLFFVSAIGSGAPFGIIDFIMWRFIGGLAIGVASIIVPIYIAETVPAHFRGRLASMQQFAIVIGIFTALLSNYLIMRIAGSASSTLFGFEAWKVMFWVETIPAFIYGLAALRLPESPRYLISKGKFAEAREVLATISDNDVDSEIEIIQHTYENKERAKLSDLFENVYGKTRIAPVVWAGIGIAVLQQFVGINVIFYYGTMLWQSVGFEESDAFLTSLIASGINLIMTVVAILLIDKIGRKPLLLIGSAGMAVTLGILALCFIFGTESGVLRPDIGILALISANLYVTFFAATWGPVLWVMLGEMFNNRIRAVAISVCGLAQWLANFLVSWSFPVLAGENGIGVGPTYLIYAVFAVISFFFVLKFTTETKGKTLEEM
ncbi:sugar porter family MFS transporter [Fibrobacter sp.]|uniref:sugar porter family MFS transporter n=1 Tax=Fibrobacter sp. TaxID=35828 RepID=UPI003890DDE8